MHKPELPGRLVELRPSQVKFKANEYFLEVVRGSTFTQGYLNRQIILLLSCLGVSDDVFIHHLNNAMDSLDLTIVLSNLEKIYKKSKKHKSDRKNLAQEMELFFGPSKVFGPIFKHALVRSFDLKHEQRKVKKQQQLLTEEEKEAVKSASNSQVDEIENLEKMRDEGVRPGGSSGHPLSE